MHLDRAWDADVLVKGRPQDPSRDIFDHPVRGYRGTSSLDSKSLGFARSRHTASTRSRYFNRTAAICANAIWMVSAIRNRNEHAFDELFSLHTRGYQPRLQFRDKPETSVFHAFRRGSTLLRIHRRGDRRHRKPTLSDRSEATTCRTTRVKERTRNPRISWIRGAVAPPRSSFASPLSRSRGVPIERPEPDYRQR